MIKAIMACDCNGGIARNGSMPWPRNDRDLSWFKRNTMNCTVVMGKGTWNDPFMPSPLPGRKNVVVTHDPESCPGADHYITGDLLEELKKLEEESTHRDVWIIGGANLLEQAMPAIEQFYITIFDEAYECDTSIHLKDILRSMNEIGTHDEPGMHIKILEKFKGMTA